MIESVLNLGVKGADLVVSQLEKIQEEKEKFSRPANLTVKTTQSSPLAPPNTQKAQTADTKSVGLLKGIQDAVKGQKETLSKGLEQRQKTKEPEKDTGKPEPQTKEDKDEKKQSSDSFKEVTQAAKTAAQGLATLSAGGALQGAVTALRAIPFVGEYAAAAGNAILTSAQAFRDNVKSAASINFNTAESESRIGNIFQGSGGRNFTGRSDIDLNTQRSLAEAIGEKFGTVQKPLADSIKQLFADRNGQAVSVQQASQLAQGQFSALGTDKGFFLQKIQDQLNGLPPSLKQAMTASLLKNVTKEEQATETSRGERAIVTAFDQQERTKAREIATPVAAQQALQINGLLTSIDASLNTGFSNLLTGLNNLSRAIQTRSVQPLIDGAGTVGRP